MIYHAWRKIKKEKSLLSKYICMYAKNMTMRRKELTKVWWYGWIDGSVIYVGRPTVSFKAELAVWFLLQSCTLYTPILSTPNLYDIDLKRTQQILLIKQKY